VTGRSLVTEGGQGGLSAADAAVRSPRSLPANRLAPFVARPPDEALERLVVPGLDLPWRHIAKRKGQQGLAAAGVGLAAGN
jgi:hypothetical protein